MTTPQPPASQPILPPSPTSLDDTQPMQPVSATAGCLTWLTRLTLLAATGVLLLLMLVALFIAAHETRYAGRVYPGVSTFGVDLTGMTQAEALHLLDARFVYDDEAVFTLTYGTQTWTLTAGELGVFFDAEQTANAALLIGRTGTLPDNLIAQTDVWFNGRAIAPIIVYDQAEAEALLTRIAWEIDQPMQDGNLMLMGTQVVGVEGQAGRTLDVAASLDLIRQRVLSLEPGGELPLVVHETEPQVWSVAEAESQLRAALAAPLALYADENSGGAAGPWTATPDQIAQMLTVNRVTNPDGTADFTVNLNPEQLASFLGGIAEQLTTQPQPARFIFNDETRQLESIQDSVNGRELDINQSLNNIEAALFTTADELPVREVPLAFHTVVPAIHAGATAAELGITELVGEATTYYLGSTASRQDNIREAASRFNGVVIAPNEEFSFNQWLGDVSLESGFEESFIIFGGRTIKGVGGGVCQVSTTAFQAAFYTGFPIVERYPHGYRVGYYEYGEGVGMDATVYSPLVDFRFLNDTPYHLLIETETNSANSTITFRFYSTEIGREVVKVGPRIANEQSPGETIYEENADLYTGQTRQVEWAVSGAEVTVTRQVWRDGQLEQEDHFFSNYTPWAAVIQVAPGDLPGQNSTEG